MKLCFFTDLHARGTNPRSRRDNYMETMRRKLAEVGQLALDHKCTAVLFGGDLTDTPDISESTLGDLIKDLRAMPVPVYGVWGNTHDIWGDNPATKRRTALGVVEAAEAIHLLEAGAPVILEEGDLRVQISGQGYHETMDRRDWRLDYCVYPADSPLAPEGHQHWRLPDVNHGIHIVHGMLRTRPLMAGIPVTLIEDVLRETVADITLSGHDHNGYGVIEAHGRKACNPGALMRLTAAREELTRPVQVALITLTATESTIELITLQSAAPGEEVLDRSGIDAEKARKDALLDFSANIGVGGQFEAMDLAAIVERVAANKHVSVKVRNKALTYIHEAIEAAGKEEVVTA